MSISRISSAFPDYQVNDSFYNASAPSSDNITSVDYDTSYSQPELELEQDDTGIKPLYDLAPPTLSQSASSSRNIRNITLQPTDHELYLERHGQITRDFFPNLGDRCEAIFVKSTTPRATPLVINYSRHESNLFSTRSVTNIQIGSGRGNRVGRDDGRLSAVACVAIFIASVGAIFGIATYAGKWGRQINEAKESNREFLVNPPAGNTFEGRLVQMNNVIISSTRQKYWAGISGIACGILGIGAAVLASPALAWGAVIGGVAIATATLINRSSGDSDVSRRIQRVYERNMEELDQNIGHEIGWAAEDAERQKTSATTLAGSLRSIYGS